MKALVGQFKKIDLSYTYDSLTIYPKYALHEPSDHFTLTACFNVIEKIGARTAEGKHFYTFIKAVKTTDLLHYQRSIIREDNDHDFYHHDLLPDENHHFHLKFKTQLTRDDLVTLLDLFITFELISNDEKLEFLKRYDSRYEFARKELENALSNNQENDTKAIINVIKNCSDNDILANLHQYLLMNNKFDYLRVQSPGSSISKQWQGSNSKGEVVPTSESWARIEKAFSLKMAINIRDHAIKKNEPLNIKVGLERATQLSKTHSFFSIKRKATSSAKMNKGFNALCNANEKELERIYNKVF